MRNIAFGTLIVASSAFLVYSFPDGAPVDTCVKPSKPNEPNHGQAKSQPVETSPYAFTASSSEYGPGSQITGKLLICQPATLVTIYNIKSLTYLPTYIVFYKVIGAETRYRKLIRWYF